MRSAFALALVAVTLGSCTGGGQISAPLIPLAASSVGASAEPLASTETQTVIARRNFTDELPDNLKTAKVERKTSTLEVGEGAGFQALIHYDDLTEQAGYFRHIEVEVPNAPSGTTVTADIGNPTNYGSTSRPMMAVPIKIQWQKGNNLETRMWTFSFDGQLKPR